jgi:cell division protein FtsQ
MASTTLNRPPTRPSGAVRTPAAGKQPRRGRRRRWLRWVAAFLVLALIGGVGWLLGFSSVFATRQVNVAGVRVLDAAQVRDAGSVPIGLPLARQDLDAIASRVATLAPVESVTVDRAWPDAIDIRVTERTPVLALREIGGVTLVDREGVAFDQVPSRPDGVVLAETDPRNLDLLVQIGVVARALPAELRPKVASIKASTPNQLVVVLSSGLTITWGTADQSALKAQIVTALLRQDPRAIDVSSPHNPAIR